MKILSEKQIRDKLSHMTRTERPHLINSINSDVLLRSFFVVLLLPLILLGIRCAKDQIMSFFIGYLLQKSYCVYL